MTIEKELKTTICIMGAGPAGIVLANILLQHHLDCIVIDARSREEIFGRGQAGVIESTTVDCLKKHGLAEPILNNGRTNDRCEFRSPAGSVMFEYGQLSGGDTHFIYMQNNLVDDLTQIYLDRGGKIFFSRAGRKLHNEDDHIAVECDDKLSQTTITIHSDFVAGCDGQHGVSRQSIPNDAVNIYRKQHNFNWLAILAYAKPSADYVIYALHPDGFAGHMPRNSEMSRYYLQIPLDDDIEAWPDKRIWPALQKRLAKKDWTLREGKIGSKSILSLHSYVTEPLRYKRLFIVGDAAHLLPPCGGKGMNLAIQDASFLAETLIDWYQEQHPLSYLDRYSAIRLPFIWRAQEFSYSMMNMIHKAEGDNLDDVKFIQKLKESKLTQLETSKTFAKDFARNYVGII
jgi:p-hydroxybenzoate 3-monooxygenase